MFHHSNGTTAEPTGVYGLAKVASKPHPDKTQFDKKGKGKQYYDPKATEEKPIWYCVDVAFVKKFKIPVTLSQIKFDPNLKNMLVAKRGSRLSIMPVSEKDFEYLNKLAE